MTGTVNSLKNQDHTHSEGCCKFIEYPDGRYASIMMKKKVEDPPFQLSDNDMVELELYAQTLSQYIKQSYMNASFQNNDVEDWPLACERAMVDLILEREDWAQSDHEDTNFIYKSTYPARISILQSGSTGILMFDTALSIANAEMSHTLNMRYPDIDTTSALVEIERVLREQDWIITFSRKK